jgi:squalene-associated FAD-dependent desaturase
MRAVVVGAGLAGLSAAMRLRERGFEVVIVERSRLVGGKATSFTVDGIEVDSGQHVHLACCTEYLDFVAATGMSDVLWTQPRFDVTVLSRGTRPSRLRAAPGLPSSLALLPSFLGYRPMGMAAKWRLALALRALSTPARPGDTFAAWLRRHHQPRDAVAGFWAPFVVPALNADLDEVGAEDALFVLRTAFGNPDNARMGWSRVPLARIAEAAAGHAGELRTRTAVTSLLDDGDCLRGVRCAGGAVIEADVVVLAVPPARLSAILGTAQSFGVDGLDRFETRAIVDVHLWYDIESVGFDFAAIIGSPVQWVFEKSPGRLCCSLSSADSLVRQPEADLVELCRRELAAVWPRLAGVPLVRGAATRDVEATFVPRPGLRRPGWRTNRSNLAIAGAWTDTGWPATMESAVRSGRAAAAGVVATTSGVAPSRERAHA